MTKLDLIQTIGMIAGSTTAVGVFFHKTYKHAIEPLYLKFTDLIESEKKFRLEIRETITSVNEWRVFFELTKSEMSDFVDTIRWASLMKRYVDVPTTTAVHAPPAPNGDIKQ